MKQALAFTLVLLALVGCRAIPTAANFHSPAGALDASDDATVGGPGDADAAGDTAGTDVLVPVDGVDAATDALAAEEVADGTTDAGDNVDVVDASDVADEAGGGDVADVGGLSDGDDAQAGSDAEDAASDVTVVVDVASDVADVDDTTSDAVGADAVVDDAAVPADVDVAEDVTPDVSVAPDVEADVQPDAASNPCLGKNCDDANACTVDSCDTSGACQHTNAADWTDCGEGLVCDGAGTCADVKLTKGMAFIPAGTFWMGCNAAKDIGCGVNETLQHKVTLSAYYMDLTETTVTQYKVCVDAGVCTPPNSQSPTAFATYPGFPNNPVNFVNWAQAQAYCQWRGAEFDLPTEAQWEMAARGSCEKNGSAADDPACASAMRTYPWGEVVASCVYAVMSNGTWGCGTSATWAVGSKTAGDSPYGLHDMAGNVWEWTRDWYSATYFSSSPATDPMNAVSGSDRTIRGGSFYNDPGSLRAGFRYYYPPSSAHDLLGVRCMRSFAAPVDLCANVSCPATGCATNTCDPATGQCVATPKADATPCDDGNACTSGDACSSGTCAGTLNCDDGNACTNDSCVGLACQHLNNTAACEDGNGCTTQVCASGKCVATAVPNGVACSSGAACLAAQNCSAGSCVGGGAKLFTATSGSSWMDQFNAITPVPASAPYGAGFLLGGVTYDANGHGHFWLTRTDATGQPLFQKTHFADSGLTSVVVGVSYVVGKGYALAGSVATTMYDLNFRLVLTDGGGNKQSDNTYGTTYNEQAHGFAALGDGGFAIVGTSQTANHAFFLVRTDAAGTQVFAKTYGALGSDGDGLAVIQKADGGFAMVGNASGETVLVLTDKDGVQQSLTTFSEIGADAGAAIAQTSDGGFIIAGQNNALFMLLRCDGSGVKLWSKTYASGAANAVLALSDGYVMVGKDSANGNDGRFIRTDVMGNKLLDLAYGGTSADNLTNLIALADGFAIVGSTASFGATLGDGWLLRTDAFGNTSCGSSGACAEQTLTSCDDTNPCTADTCDATGCKHTSLTEGSACEDGSACTSNDVCSSGTCTGAVDCDDGNACTDDSCVSVACQHVNNNATCDDGNPCTTDDVCSLGVCKGAAPVCGNSSCDCGETTASCPSDCLTTGMVLIPSGTFWMGCNAAKDTKCTSSEKPQHKVTLSAYYMDLTETTVGQYKACVVAAGCTPPATGTLATYPSSINNPVNYVTWTQAQQYCKWRGAAFDLPTEAEWEMAARGSCEKNGSTAGNAACASAMRTYPWGETTPTASYAVFSPSSSTAAVGSKKSGDSPYGLHDMAGNVWEWNRDWYGAYGPDAVTDPQGPTTVSARVNRGGGFNWGESLLRTVHRGTDPVTAANNYVGFRCVRSYP